MSYIELTEPRPGEEDADWPVFDWQADVANGDTRLGYWDWVINMRARDCRNSGPYYIPGDKP